MKPPVPLALCIGLLTAQAAMLMTASPAPSPFLPDRPTLAGARPESGHRPQIASLRCRHPLSGRDMSGRDCAALLSALLLGALAQKSGPMDSAWAQPADPAH